MEILVIISFFFILSLAEWISARVIQAGIIGNIAVGIIYGVPLANILEMDWQKTFLSLGYIGLILIIFEGLYIPPLTRFGWNIVLTSPQVVSLLVSIFSSRIYC